MNPLELTEARCRPSTSLLLKVVALFATAALLFAACGSDDADSDVAADDDAAAASDDTAGDDDTADDSASDDAGDDSASDDADDAEEVTVTQGGDAGAAGPRHVCAIGGADSFFAVLKNGADLAGQAVTQAGNEYTWISLPNYDNIGPDMVRLIEQAVAQECTSLAVPVWDGAAQAPALCRPPSTRA